MRELYKGKPAAEGGSTAGQFAQFTYYCGFGKAALQDVVDFLEERCRTLCPRGLPPSDKPPKCTGSRLP